MRVEIDQSGKVGRTSDDTVIALSNGRQYAILIPRLVKQACLRELRQRGLAPNAIYTRLFVAGLFYLLEVHMTKVALAVVDMEYPGHEEQIRRQLLNLFSRAGIQVDKHQIVFDFVGKGSRAHALALATFRGKKQANRVLTVEEVLAMT